MTMKNSDSNVTNLKFFDETEAEIAEGEPYILMTKSDIQDMLNKHRNMLIRDGALPSYFDCEEAGANASTGINTQINLWLHTTPFPTFVADIKKQVIGQEGLEDILLNIYLYLYNQLLGKNVMNNILLAAPSGCGKTETYRALSAYFKKHIPSLPLSQIDITSITPEGFVGGDTNDIIHALKEKKSGGIGLIFIDEFDKCMTVLKTSSGSDLNGEVQNMLLTLIEGREIGDIDTNKTMFIGMGSFDAIRRSRKMKKAGIGFTSDHSESASPQLPTEHYSEITLEDMRAFGAIPELLGRFVTVINYHKLTDEAIDKVIDLSVAKLAETFGTSITISESVRKTLHEQANTVYGCRMFHNTLHTKAASILKENLLKGKKLGKAAIHI